MENNKEYDYKLDDPTTSALIPINLYTKDIANNLLQTDDNVNYSLSFKSTDGLVAYWTVNGLGQDSYYGDFTGEISSDNNYQFKINLFVSSNINNENIIGKSITITAKTRGTFNKTLSATYTFVENETLSDQDIRVDDEVGREYCTLVINNMGDNPKQYTVQFDQTKMLIDSTNSILENASKDDTNSNNYIDIVKFSVPENSSFNIKFYKKYKNEKYKIIEQSNGKYKIIVDDSIVGGS